MKRLYTVLVLFALTASYAGAQIVTERCWHLDKIQFLEQRQDFWRGHTLFSTASRPVSTSGGGGYYNLTEITYGFGLGITSTPFSHNHVGITTVNGWRFTNGITIGGGIGYLSYNHGESNAGWMLPVYGDVRYFVGKQKNKFFLMADGGFLFNFTDFKENARYFLNPAAGIIIPVSGHSLLSFSAGLFTQYDYDFFSRMDEGIRDSFINMKLGLLFGR